MNLIKDQLEIDWVYYMDVEQLKIPLDALVLVIIKAVLLMHTTKTVFDQDFALKTKTLSGARYGTISAWNIRKYTKRPSSGRISLAGNQSMKRLRRL
jgi:hypothetical protein